MRGFSAGWFEKAHLGSRFRLLEVSICLVDERNRAESGEIARAFWSGSVAASRLLRAMRQRASPR